MAFTGTILHLQRLSTEDGPGIRTTVFLKGCSLRCAWCHNPESLSRQPQIQRIETNCLNCGSCIRLCPQRCLSREGDEIFLDHQRCDACGICVQACPTGAMELLGKQISVEALTEELLKDRSYYQSSGGGVTFSGGEPALQSAFCAAVMENLQHEGIHTALDTCGMVNPNQLEQAMSFADMVLFDLKLLDADNHEQFTGQSNRRILENFRRVGEVLGTDGSPKRLWVRTPLIPGATDSKENLTAIGAFLTEELGDVVERWELCAFNNLCRDKYRRLGLVWEYDTTPLFSQSELDQRLEWALASGFLMDRIILSGAARVVS